MAVDVVLPSEVLILVMHYLHVPDLRALALASRLCHNLVTQYGWTDYARTEHAHTSPSLTPLRPLFASSPVSQVRYYHLTARSWAHTTCTARPLSAPWKGKLQPLMAVSPARLVVAAGSEIYAYAFAQSTRMDGAPRVVSEGVYTFAQRGDPRRDITGVVFIPDGGAYRTLCVGFEDGAIERVTLATQSSDSLAGGAPLPLPLSARQPLDIEAGDLIESLSACGHSVLSLSLGGLGTLFSLPPSAPAAPILAAATYIELPGRGWSAHLCTSASTPYAAFGTASATPLVLHALAPTGFVPAPLCVLGAGATVSARHRAVYGIARPSSGGPWGAGAQVLVSGWYDGIVRVHDVRAGGAPVLQLYDPWSTEPIYSVAAEGVRVAAGSARHSVVSFWDVRHARTQVDAHKLARGTGFSVHGPGNDSSPVYSLYMESSRVFGATQSRSFVYDFGPGVTEETYPRLWSDFAVECDPNAAMGGRQKKGGLMRDGVGYYVTKYSHSRATGAGVKRTGVRGRDASTISWR